MAVNRYNMVFIGVKTVGLRALQTLLEAKAPVVAVLTIEDQINRSIIDLAEQNNIPVLFEEDISALKQTKAQRGLVFSYPRRLSQKFIDVFSQGIYNFHPASLPEYRGCMPTVWPVLYGDHEAVCSVHEVVKDFDAGGIVLTRKIPIHDSDTGVSLYDRMVDCEIGLLDDHMTDFISGRFIPVPQDEAKAQYFKNKLPNNGEIDWTMNSQYIERFVRAVYHPLYRGAWTYINGQTVEILETRIISGLNLTPQAGKAIIQDDDLIFGCLDGFIHAKKIRLNGTVIKENIEKNLYQIGAQWVHI